MASFPINTTINAAGIDPSSLFYAPTAQAPSPACSSSSPSSNNSRKRPRTDYATSEERKEARAERNRVAAQVSRDRRKAEFGELRERVNALERENAALRAASSSGAVSALFTTTIGTPTVLETEREKENRELKERVRVLENALSTLSQNVVNALQGVSGGMGALSNLLPPVTPAPATYSAPITAQPQIASPTASSSSTLVTASDNKEVSTRHLARVAYVSSSSLSDETSLQRVEPARPPTPPTPQPRTSQSAQHPPPPTTPLLPPTTSAPSPTTAAPKTGYAPSSTPTPPPHHPPSPLHQRSLPPLSCSKRLPLRPSPTQTSRHFYILRRSLPTIPQPRRRTCRR
ncbi:hypothetical protein FRB93_014008 [Tulasnella sp. JGI-2019a]|nr:hypothetical protein FRB93_014008 [Tulasnella sp. JGI-2019a]